MTEAGADTHDAQAYRSPLESRPDRWLSGLMAVSLLVWFLLILWAGIPGPLNLLAIPLVVLGGPAAALVLILLGGHLISKRKFRKAASIALIATLPPLLWSPIFWAAACVHIPLTMALGIGQIGSPSISQDGKFAAYDWSVGLVTNPATFLIYDSTDEVALPVNKHLHPPASVNDLREECTGKVTHLLGHYYECSI